MQIVNSSLGMARLKAERTVLLENFQGNFDAEKFVDSLMRDSASSPEELYEVFQACSSRVAALQKEVYLSGSHFGLKHI